MSLLKKTGIKGEQYCIMNSIRESYMTIVTHLVFFTNSKFTCTAPYTLLKVG